MLSTDEFKAQLPNLPLAQREEMFDLLEQSIAQEHRQIATEEEAKYLEICRQWLADYDAGKTQAIPFGVVLNKLFPIPANIESRRRQLTDSLRMGEHRLPSPGRHSPIDFL